MRIEFKTAQMKRDFDQAVYMVDAFLCSRKDGYSKDETAKERFKYWFEKMMSSCRGENTKPGDEFIDPQFLKIMTGQNED